MVPVSPGVAGAQLRKQAGWELELTQWAWKRGPLMLAQKTRSFLAKAGGEQQLGVSESTRTWAGVTIF